MIILCNAFSINMLSGDADITFTRITNPADHLKRGFTSAVGHADTARVFASVLGVDVPVNRATVSLDGDTILIVGQYKGPRLPEGATSLPVGATIEWWMVCPTLGQKSRPYSLT